MLDPQAGVKAMRLAYCRIDGDVASAEERQALVQRFQTRHDIPVFLLTSQVGMEMGHIVQARMALWVVGQHAWQ